MRDTAARRGADPAPRSAKAPSKHARPSRGFPGIRHWGKVRRYGSRGLLWSGFAGLMAVVVVNATALQKGHHPAPLIMPPEPSRAALPEPPVRQVASAAPTAAPAPTPAAVEPAPAPDAPAARASVPAAIHRDGIGQLLKGGAASRSAVTAHPRAVETRAAPKVPASHPDHADRDRLAAMMGAAVTRGHAPVAN